MNRPTRLAILGAVTGFVTALGLGVGSTPAGAHPLGNLTVNTAALITVAPESTTVLYVLDLAELPTVQEAPRLERDGDGYAEGKCTELAGGIGLTVDGDAGSLTAAGATATELPGQGGLSTLRVECRYTTSGVDRRAAISWQDLNFGDRIGWREVIAVGDGTLVDGGLPTVSASDLLRRYPVDAEPARVLSAEFSARPGGPRLEGSTAATAANGVEPQRRGADGLTARFNRIVGERDLTVGLALVAGAIAFLLGAFHSLAPGHGKTLMAAMVAGRRGTTRQVLTVGATVAATHTLGVVALGAVITTSQAIAPDRVLPWLTVASGLLLLATGIWLLARRVLFGAPQGHSHGTFGHSHGPGGHTHGAHGHTHGPGAHTRGPHDHGAHDHGPDGHSHPHDVHGHDLHGPGAHTHGHHEDADADHAHSHGHGDLETVGGVRGEGLRTRSLALIGMAGGMVPTPSALVVLLGAAALGRAWFGVILVGVYGIGMAATLLAAGYALVRLQGWVERQYADARWLQFGLRILPVTTALLLVAGGLSLAVRGAIAT